MAAARQPVAPCRCVALFNFPQDQLDAGYTSALIARAAFEEATTELGIRGIHLTCPHPAQEAFAVAARLLAESPNALRQSPPAGSSPVYWERCESPTCTSRTNSPSFR